MRFVSNFLVSNHPRDLTSLDFQQASKNEYHIHLCCWCLTASQPFNFHAITVADPCFNQPCFLDTAWNATPEPAGGRALGSSL